MSFFTCSLTSPAFVELKLAYDFTPTLQAGFTLGYWHQKYNSDTQSFLRDAAGNPVYSGLVNIGGYEYNVPAATFARLIARGLMRDNSRRRLSRPLTWSQ